MPLTIPEYSSGYPTNLNPWFGPGPGDFPPLSTHALLGTSPLIPTTSVYFESPNTLPERQTIAGVLDQITGTPLLRHIDFELPFGGATYRLTRTYGELPGITMAETERAVQNPASVRPSRDLYEHELLWDWCGQGWMIGENPVFLFDASYWGMITDRYHRPSIDGPVDRRPTRCYFIPDAHRSIPFDQYFPDEDEPPVYLAPTHLDAQMWCEGGTWDSSTHQWTTPPQFVHIALQNGQVLYKVRLHHGAHLPPPLSSEQFSPHDRPGYVPSNTPTIAGPYGPFGEDGFGVPTLGLVEEIRDTAGNRIILEHCTPTTYTNDITHTDGCVECEQTCQRFGQLRKARLIAAGSETATWTLLYTHRNFRLCSDDFDPNNTKPFFPTAQHALLNVHAYQGEADAAVECSTIEYSTIDAWVLDYIENGPEHADTSRARVLDALDEAPVEEWAGLPSNWTHKATFRYLDPWWTCASSPLKGTLGPSLLTLHAGISDLSQLLSPRLIVARVEVRDTVIAKKETISTNAPSQTPKINYSAYGYQTIKHCDEQNYHQAFLLSYWSPETIASTIALFAKHAAAAATDSSLPPETIEALNDLTTPTANELLSQHRNLLVPEPATAGPDNGMYQITRKFYQHADLEFYNNDLAGLAPDTDFEPSATSYWEKASCYLQSPIDKLHNIIDAVRRVIVRSGSNQSERTFYVHRFMRRPDGATAPYPSTSFDIPNSEATPGSGQTLTYCDPPLRRSIFHYPYRYISTTAQTGSMGIRDDYTGDPTKWVIPSLDTPLWQVLVREKLRSWEPFSQKEPSSSLPTEDGSNCTISAYSLNSAGVLLRSRVWNTCEPVDCTQGVPSTAGFGEDYIYEEINPFLTTAFRRLKERRSVGWSSPHNTATTMPTTGLVHVFDYYGTSGPNAFLVAKEGIRSGSDASQPVYWTRQFVRNPALPRLLDAQIEFTTPTTAASGPGIETTYTHVFGVDDPTTPEIDPPLLKRTTSSIGDTTSLAAAYAVPSSVSVELFDELGQLRGQGQGDASKLFVTAFEYDGGHLVSESIDVAQITVGAASIQRVSPTDFHSPLNLSTAYAYRASSDTPWLTVLPQGTEVHVHERISDPAIPMLKERRTYRDVAVSGSSATTLSPVLVEKYEHEHTLAVSHGALAWPGGSPPTLSLPIQDDSSVPNADLISIIEIDRDPNGRPQALTAIDATDSSSLTARVMSDGFGHLIRSQSPDGTITRNIFDLRGRLTHVYRGTLDDHAVWWNRTGSTIDCTTVFDDNLTLIEKREYGEGINDALQLVAVRSYRSKPTNQYRRVGCHDTPNDEDDIGFVTRTRYDWRMRPVVSQRFGEGAGTSEPPLTQTVTFLDHANRVRFVAEYGPDRPTGELDPITRAISADVPSAADLLSASLAPNERPLQLTEHIYATRGDLVEVRQYDVNDTSASAYTFTHTVPDYAGRPILVQDTNGGVTRNKYDAIGRLLVTSTYATDVELTRATFTYDLAGNTISHALTERVLADSDNELDGGNSVTSYTHNWYDTSNRLIATVEYGAADSSGIYKSNTEPTRATVPPLRASIPSDARMTESFYDRFGREWQTVYPNGSAIQNDYDGLGRVILVRELDAPNGNILRRTAYRYDDAGRLWMIAAVRPEHGPTVTWNVSDESLQITELLYSTLETDPNDPDAQIEIPGAVVTNENGEEISRHAGWVARVKFPDAPCPCDANGSGAIDPDDIFFYLDAWFLQNGLSSPPTPISELTTDMNGDHTVNADDIFAFLDCWFAPPGGCSSGWENQAGDLQFKYLADGRLHSRTSIDGSTFTYAYDALDRLHAISATSSSPATALVVDALTSIVYEHDAASRLTRATAHTIDTSNQPRLVSDSLFEYDGFGRLTAERSALGAAANSATPGIAYEWSTASTAAGGIDRPNTSRLSAMTYGHTPSLPSGATAPATRSLSFSYGSTDSATDLLSRIAGMSDGRLSTLNADWTYSGLGSRIRERMGLDSGSDPALEVNANAALASSLARVTGWSAFKQRTTNAYTSRALTGASIYSAQHAFDRSGSRTKDEVAFTPTLSTTDTARSWAYAYDPLNRLVAADRGLWNSGGSGGIDFASSPTTGLGIQWNLDDLGNWVGDDAATPALAGRIEHHGFDSLGLPRFETATTHSVNERNELSDHATAITDNDPPGGGGTPTINSSTAKVFYDRTGHLTYDGTSGHLYRYDHWGRLVEVRAAIGLSMNADGSITGASPGDAPPGRLVAHYVYDALGRLVSRQTPHTGPPATTTPPTPDHYDIRQELYFYDGVRRVRDFASILERPIPLPATPPEPESPWTGELGVPLEADAQRAVLGLGEEADLPTPLLTREYIWTPAADGYVDELLAQVVWTWSSPNPPTVPTATETVLFAIRNANHNVVGLTDDEGEPAAWFGYTPYGELDFVQAGSSPHAAPALASRVGHQGLFFDNLETPWAANQLTLRGNGPSPTAHAGLYHNRNRSYLPSLGRFAQRDPNASGIVTADVGWWRGYEPVVSTPLFEITGLYHDGLSLHQYLGSSPTDLVDPTGRWFGMAMNIGGMAVDSYMSAVGTMGDAMQGVTLVGAFGQALDSYSIDRIMDVNWAMDWSQGDNWYSQSGISDAALYGADEPDGAYGVIGGPALASAFPGQTATLDHLGRAHGGGWHNARLHAMAEHYTAELGPDNVRFNQSIKMADGSIIKPDLIIKNKDGTYQVFEVMDTSHLTQREMLERNNSIAKSLGVDESQVTSSQIDRTTRMSPGMLRRERAYRNNPTGLPDLPGRRQRK